jgi:hypothetical protein
MTGRRPSGNPRPDNHWRKCQRRRRFRNRAPSSAGQLKPKPDDPDSTPCFDPYLHVGLLEYYEASNSYRSDEPGFDANFEADPEQDYYPLEYGAQVWLVAAEDLSPAFRVEYQSYQIRVAGDELPLGSYLLHRHVIYIVDCADPQYDPLRTLWYGWFILRDKGSTGYGDSEPFPLRFSIVECRSGDVNGDGLVGFGDINPFVAVLAHPAQATAEQRCAADINRDGYVTFGDINPFVSLLAQGG